MAMPHGPAASPTKPRRAIEQIVAENHRDSESAMSARPNQNQATENDHRDSDDPDD